MTRPRASTLTVVNTVLSGVVLSYAIGIENRIATLEARLNMLMNGATITLPQNPPGGQAHGSVQGR